MKVPSRSSTRLIHKQEHVFVAGDGDEEFGDLGRDLQDRHHVTELVIEKPIMIITMPTVRTTCAISCGSSRHLQSR